MVQMLVRAATRPKMKARAKPPPMTTAMTLPMPLDSIASGPAEQEHVLAAFLPRMEQGIAGLLGVGRHVRNRAGVGGDDAQDLAWQQAGKRLAGLHDGQRTGQTRGVQFLVEVHSDVRGVGCSFFQAWKPPATDSALG